MKTFIVYINGEEMGYIKAGSHNAAEKKAIKKFKEYDPIDISVAYTELADGVYGSQRSPFGI